MIYFMRHGQDDENYVGGWSDVPLITSGEEEVLETANIVNNVLKVDISLDSNLREQNKGLLNGLLKDIAYNKYPGFKDGEITVDTVFPEGESLRDLYNRIKDYFNDITELEDDTLIITHRGVINMIYYLLYDKEVDIDKKQFGVTTASIHELDKTKKAIRKVR